MFRYIKFVLNAKKGLQKPDELAADLSFGLVEGFFILGLIIALVVAGLSGYFGYRFDYGFLKFLMVLSGLFFLGFLALYVMLKKMITKATSNITHRVKNRIDNNHVVDVEAHTTDKN